MGALSPLTRSNLLARERGDAPAARPTRAPGRHTRYRCHECSSLHAYKSSAERCCPPDVDEVLVDDTGTLIDDAVPGMEDQGPYDCPVCGDANTRAHDAVDCCLWRDHDFPTRYRIAEAVNAGATWAEAIAKESQ